MMRNVINIPNILSLSRLPIAIGIIMCDSVEIRYLLIFVGIFSDYLDGYAARKFNQATQFGALVDPVFDRIFVLVIFVFYYLKLEMPFYFVVLFFLRDIITVFSSIIILLLQWQSRITIQARFSGKVVTAAQFLALLVMVSENRQYTEWIFYVVFVLSIYSLADYLFYAKKCLRGNNNGE